jgi:amino acid adenylation domain-containing protein
MNEPTWFSRVAEQAEASPESEALRDGQHGITYRVLIARARTLAAWLSEHGTRPGDRVVVHLHKGVEEVLATLACARLGAVFVHVHPQLTLGQLRHVLSDSGARTLITHARRGLELATDVELLRSLVCLAAVGDAAPEGGWLGPCTSWPNLDEQREAAAPLPRANSLGALLYTSGSTGKPKGVMHSQENLLQFALNVAEYLKLQRDDRLLGLLPISFGYGLNQLLTALLVGGRLVLQKAPFPAEVVKTLASEGVTGLAAVPSVWQQLLSFLDQTPTALPSLRYLTNAGGHLNPEAAQRLRHHLPGAEIVLMYGSTETLRSTFLPPALFESKLGSIGMAIPNVEIQVIDPEGHPCAVDQPGELVHCGSHVSQGYWNNPEETRARFRDGSAFGERWANRAVYHSGDLVRRDADGVLWFVSRAGWMVKSGGFRFSLLEVEDTLMRSGLLEQVAAFTVDHEALGQAVHVAFSPRGAAPCDNASLERYCWQAMPSYMIPKSFFPWQGQFPLLANGKLDRVALVAALQADAARPD